MFPSGCGAKVTHKPSRATTVFLGGGQQSLADVPPSSWNRDSANSRHDLYVDKRAARKLIEMTDSRVDARFIDSFFGHVPLQSFPRIAVDRLSSGELIGVNTRDRRRRSQSYKGRGLLGNYSLAAAENPSFNAA